MSLSLYPRHTSSCLGIADVHAVESHSLSMRIDCLLFALTNNSNYLGYKRNYLLFSDSALPFHLRLPSSVHHGADHFSAVEVVEEGLLCRIGKMHTG